MTTLEMLREYRIAGFTVFDTGLTVIAVLLLAPFLTRLFRRIHLEISLLGWFLFTLPLSVVVHIAARQDTTLTRQILDPDGYYLSKFVILALLVAALCTVRRIEKK